MTLTNHLLTGALIGKLLPLPIAVPVAFASHFLLDSLPHFGFDDFEEEIKKHARLWQAILIVDFILAVIFSAWLIRTSHYQWFIVGLVAYSPDVIWIYRFIFEEKFGHKPEKKGGRFIQFHKKIQKYESLKGGLVEICYALGLFLIIR